MTALSLVPFGVRDDVCQHNVCQHNVCQHNVCQHGVCQHNVCQHGVFPHTGKTISGMLRVPAGFAHHLWYPCDGSPQEDPREEARRATRWPLRHGRNA